MLRYAVSCSGQCIVARDTHITARWTCNSELSSGSKQCEGGHLCSESKAVPDSGANKAQVMLCRKCVLQVCTKVREQQLVVHASMRTAHLGLLNPFVHLRHVLGNGLLPLASSSVVLSPLGPPRRMVQGLRFGRGQVFVWPLPARTLALIEGACLSMGHRPKMSAPFITTENQPAAACVQSDHILISAPAAQCLCRTLCLRRSWRQQPGGLNTQRQGAPGIALAGHEVLLLQSSYLATAERAL